MHRACTYSLLHFSGVACKNPQIGSMSSAGFGFIDFLLALGRRSFHGLHCQRLHISVSFTWLGVKNVQSKLLEDDGFLDSS
jgi:hypothetical protein